MICVDADYIRVAVFIQWGWVVYGIWFERGKW